ncbi:MAG: tRNA lysidine(34) synthetase TilS [Nitrospirota bacterium]
MSLLESFLTALKQFPIGASDRIVVAVSGGADSVCLLHLLRQGVSPDRLQVAHLNHGFRAESVFEAEAVSSLCQSWGIACTIASRPVSQICLEKRFSKQEGARFVRYEFLREVAQSVGAKWIVLGHTADDQVETVLQHLLRGAGMAGLRGMPQSRSDGDTVIIRPMLSLTKADILSELSAAKVSFVEDPSNNDKRYVRNKIRHELIPVLTSYNPAIKKVLLREAALLEEEGRFIETEVALVIQKIITAEEADTISFDLSRFLSLPLTLRRRVVRWGIQKVRGDLTGISFEAIERVLRRVFEQPESFILSLPRGIRISQQKTALTFFVERPVRVEPLQKTASLAFEIPLASFENAIPQWGLEISTRVESRNAPLSFISNKDEAVFDLDQISSPVIIRQWVHGDRFVPFGMAGWHKKVHDFFIDLKIPKSKRNQVPLLVCPQGIIWVMGYRTDERFRVTDATKRLLWVKMRIV